MESHVISKECGFEIKEVLPGKSNGFQSVLKGYCGFHVTGLPTGSHV